MSVPPAAMNCRTTDARDTLSLTSYGSKQDIRFDVCVDIVIALGFEGRASGEDGV